MKSPDVALRAIALAAFTSIVFVAGCGGTGSTHTSTRPAASPTPVVTFTGCGSAQYHPPTPAPIPFLGSGTLPPQPSLTGPVSETDALSTVHQLLGQHPTSAQTITCGARLLPLATVATFLDGVSSPTPMVWVVVAQGNISLAGSGSSSPAPQNHYGVFLISSTQPLMLYRIQLYTAAPPAPFNGI